VSERWPRLAVVAVFVGLALVTVRDLDRPFGNGDEVVYAQGIREMKATGDLATLHWLGQPVLERPTTAFAPVAAISALVPGELGLRLFAGLCSLGILLLTYRVARDLGLAREVAVSAVLVVAGIPSFHLFSRALLTDPPYVLATTFALWAAVRARSRPSLQWVALGLGAAVACKSLAAAIPALVLAPWLLGPVRAATRRQWATALAVFVALALPYYVVSVAVHGTTFLEQHFGRTLVDRAQGDLAMGMPGGIAAYAIYTWQAEGAIVSLALALGSVLGVVLDRRRGQLALLGSFALGGFVLLSLVGTRLPHYLLPLYPAAGVALLGVVDRARARLPVTPVARVVPVVLAVALFAIGLGKLPEEHFMPSDEAVALGRVAGQRAGDDPLYTLDWYAPAAAYYAERPWVLLTTSKMLFDRLDAVDHIHAARAVATIPPWPPRGFLVAGDRAQVAQIPGTVHELAVQGDRALAWVEPAVHLPARSTR